MIKERRILFMFLLFGNDEIQDEIEQMMCEKSIDLGKVSFSFPKL
jgi:hypothetical protein